MCKRAGGAHSCLRSVRVTGGQVCIPRPLPQNSIIRFRLLSRTASVLIRMRLKCCYLHRAHPEEPTRCSDRRPSGQQTGPLQGACHRVRNKAAGDEFVYVFWDFASHPDIVPDQEIQSLQIPLGRILGILRRWVCRGGNGGIFCRRLRGENQHGILLCAGRDRFSAGAHEEDQREARDGSKASHK